MSASEIASIVQDPGVNTTKLMPSEPVSTMYQMDNNTEMALERTKRKNTYRRNFANLNFGSQGLQFQINNRDAIDQLTVHMKVPGPLPENVVLPRGWGLNMIEQIEYDFGGSERLQFTGRELFQGLMAESDTDSKRLSVLRLAGEKVDSSSPAEAQDSIVAHVPILTPFSAIKAYEAIRHVPFDSRLINSPINVTLRLADKSCVFAGEGADNAPDRLDYGYFQLRTFEIYRAEDQLVRTQLLSQPGAMYSYRFMYGQPQYVGRFTGSTDKCDKVSLDLSAFRHGNLQSIVLYCRRVSDGPTSSTAIKNVHMYRPITNVALYHSGTELFVTDEKGDGTVDALSSTLSSGHFVDVDYIVPTSTTAPFTSVPDRSYWTKISMVPHDEKTFDGIIQSGVDYGSETLSVSFNTESDDEYDMYATYNYQALCAVGNQAGKIRFTLR